MENCEFDNKHRNSEILDSFLNERPVPKDYVKKPLLMTFTGEPTQYCRLHYEILNKKSLFNAMARLKCLEYDKKLNRWMWFYENEALELKFVKPFSSIPKHMIPLIIGYFYVREKELLLDVNSYDRTLKAIPFFEKYIGKSLACLEDIEIMNEFVTGEENKAKRHEYYFDKNRSTRIDPDAKLEELEKTLNQIENQDDKLKALSSLTQEKAKKALPLTERFPTFFYEDGLSHLQGSLAIRSVIAMQHWKGDIEFSIFDAVNGVFSHARKYGKI